jgi:hypothetical protein
MTAQTETPETEPAELDLASEIYSEHVEITDAEKLDYVFRKFLELDALIEQAGPLLEQAGPLLGQFAGQASSPLGRIAGSLFR